MPVIITDHSKAITNNSRGEEVEENEISSTNIKQDVKDSAYCDNTVRKVKPVSLNQINKKIGTSLKPIKIADSDMNSNIIPDDGRMNHDRPLRRVEEKKSKDCKKQRYTTYIERAILKKIRALESLGKIESATALVNAALYDYLERYYKTN